MSTLVSDRTMNDVISHKIATDWRVVLEIEDVDLFLDEFRLYHSSHPTALVNCYIPLRKGTVIGLARYNHFVGRSILKNCFVGRLRECTALKTEQEIFDAVDEAIPSEVGADYIECTTKLVVGVSQVIDPKIRDAPFISDD